LLDGDTRHEIALREGQDGLQVAVDGTLYLLEVEPVGPGSFLLRLGDEVERFHCVRAGSDVHLFWRGVVYRLQEEREGSRRRERHTASGLEAPMPGKVIKVNAAPGQRVTKGEEVLVVEAMKMENAIRAPRDGTVKSVAVRVGDMVAPGSVLVELE
jgi:3-methylcrotonyl-CoA carboxylase alpha subunit